MGRFHSTAVASILSASIFNRAHAECHRRLTPPPPPAATAPRRRSARLRQLELGVPRRRPRAPCSHRWWRGPVAGADLQLESVATRGVSGACELVEYSTRSSRTSDWREDGCMVYGCQRYTLLTLGSASCQCVTVWQTQSLRALYLHSACVTCSLH